MERVGGTATVTAAPGEAWSRAAPITRCAVVLVDDHGLFRAGVRSELGKTVEIVGEAGSVLEATSRSSTC
jgi:hypothetical protein